MGSSHVSEEMKMNSMASPKRTTADINKKLSKQTPEIRKRVPTKISRQSGDDMNIPIQDFIRQ